VEPPAGILVCAHDLRPRWTPCASVSICAFSLCTMTASCIISPGISEQRPSRTCVFLPWLPCSLAAALATVQAGTGEIRRIFAACNFRPRLPGGFVGMGSSATTRWKVGWNEGGRDSVGHADATSWHHNPKQVHASLSRVIERMQCKARLAPLIYIPSTWGLRVLFLLQS